MQDDVIAYADARDLLRLLEPIRGRLVLIGGQAVNFWAERYEARAAELQKEAPFASKDVDFCGDVDLARQCAKLLGGVCKVSTPDDLTRRLAVVEYMDATQRARSVDFLAAPYGVAGAEVYSLSIVVEDDVPDGIVDFRVMHPVHVLESRASNVDELPGYRSEKGLKQLRSAIVCVQEFARDLLDAGHVRDVLRLNERVFRFSLQEHGLGVWLRDGISVFDGVLVDPRLPAAFSQVRYPQMQGEVEERRRRRAEREDRIRRRSDVSVVESVDALGSKLVATLRASDGSLHQVRDYRPGEHEASAGDRVRLGPGGRLTIVSRDRDRGWER